MGVFLPPFLGEKMAHAPESGMGYQIVDINLSNGRSLNHVLLYNSVEVDVTEDALSGAEIVDVELSKDQRRPG
jgi:hypothetical protein